METSFMPDCVRDDAAEMLTTATKLVAQSGSVLSRAGIPSSWTDELNDIHDELIVYLLQFNAAWKER